MDEVLTKPLAPPTLQEGLKRWLPPPPPHTSAGGRAG